MKVNRNYRRNKLLTCSVIAVLGIGLLVYIFGASGPFMRLEKIDLSFLLTPSLILLTLLIVSAVMTTVSTQYSFLMAIVIQYAAFAFFIYMVADRATLFSRIPSLYRYLDSLSIISAAALFMALFWVGLGSYQMSTLLPPRNQKLPGHRPLLSMLGFFIIGFSLWKTLDILGGHWSFLQGIGFVIGLSLIVVSLTRLTAYITTPLTILAGIIKWCLNNPVKLFWISILVMMYFVFARPMLFSISAYAYLIEWVLICFLGYQILNKVKDNLRIINPKPSIEDYWKRHQQIVNKIPDDDFNKMIILQEEFVQSGARRNLLQFLRQLLANNGIPETHIISLLKPMIEHNDVRARWYHRWFFKKRLIQGIRFRRIEVLEDSMDGIREVIYPTYK